MKASSRMSGESRIARIAGTIVTWFENTEKLPTSSSRARISVSAVDGAVVSKPIAKNTTCRSGCARALQGVERRVNHPDVGAARLPFERAAVPARHAHHVAECREDGVMIVDERQALVDAAHRQDAHRAARTVDQLDVRRQQIRERE